MNRIVAGLTGALIAASLTVSHASPASARTADLPDDGPPALYRAEATLPVAQGWPASEAFSRTSGAGRYADGAYFWTDYLYDDHGATTVSIGNPAVTAGSPSFGLYTYPSARRYANNGADIFRAAVAVRPQATFWRVDWVTLVDRKVPMAIWTFDRDDDTSTGVSSWPAGAGVSSPGIDTALVVTGQRAVLIDLVTNQRHQLTTTVTTGVNSFVVKVPRALLDPRGTWRVRLGAGLADGTSLNLQAPPDALPGATRLYNVTFRTRASEGGFANFWNDQAQASALDTGAVAGFSQRLAWSDLARRRQTAQPRPTGWSDRWYVSAVKPGDGAIVGPDSIADGEANFLSRVQPYGVYLPTGVARKRKLPLTFLLHSLTQNHNQYAATTPNFTQQACQQRRSLCVTTLGRGPDGGYRDIAELDFWEVWRSVAQAYRLDPERTVLSGYSMGGIGSNSLAIAHPDLFAKAVTLAGGVGDQPAMSNLRWVPVYLAGGAADELVPVTVQQSQASALETLGYRVRWLVVPAMDHVAYELCDCFADAAAYMGTARRVRRPAMFDFRWTPRETVRDTSLVDASIAQISWTQNRKLGVHTTGAYWLRDLAARSQKQDGQIHADSRALPYRPPTASTSSTLDPTISPMPSVLRTTTWQLGQPRDRSNALRLDLTNVGSLRLLPKLAGLRAGARITVHTDGATVLRIGENRYRFANGTHRLTLERD